MKSTFFLGICTLLSLSCASNEENENPQSAISETTEITNQTVARVAEDVSAQKFKELIDKTPGQLIDVRTPGEFSGGHIEGAQNIDYYADNFAEQLQALDKDVPVYVYCKSGGRSGKAKDMLVEQGFQTVYNLIGGYSNWSF